MSRYMPLVTFGVVMALGACGDSSHELDEANERLEAIEERLGITQPSLLPATVAVPPTTLPPTTTPAPLPGSKERPIREGAGPTEVGPLVVEILDYSRFSSLDDEPPSDLREFVGVRIRVTNQGDAVTSMSSVASAVYLIPAHRDGNAVAGRRVFGAQAGSKPLALMPDLDPGSTAEGWIFFEIFEGETEDMLARLDMDPTRWPGGLHFDLTL